MSQPQPSPATGSRSRLRTAFTILCSLLLVVVAWGVWQGYLPRFTETCPSSDIIGPSTYAEVRDAGFAPYCARSVLGENWL